MRRIGIMGGTFNPIHNGHLAIADKAREQFALEKVLFMPSGIPYMKDQREVLPIQTRCEMTALAIKDMPGFELSEMEASDAALGKNTYTCDTLQKLKAADPEADYYFILGADSLYAMEDWKNPALIFQNCTVLAAVRTTVTLSVKDGTSESGMRESGKQTQEQQPHFSEQVRYLQEKYHASVKLLEFAGMDISSTQIRAMVKAGKSLQGLVPEAVAVYIWQNHLYEKDS
ncbi:MAG: nicotinate (nicotinamide) nucleotide adenylyltransferase [Lachnospiraceae bacterium]|jgi:nicotinate-nucleotide adenylyltransferase|nr:nicotinate (nicotinamide) nucleotide adenylyltransferase [Lachnospiraceae bacterium]